MRGDIFALSLFPLSVLDAPSTYARTKTEIRALHVVNTSTKDVNFFATRGVRPSLDRAIYWQTLIKSGAVLKDDSPHILNAGESLWCWGSKIGLICSVSSEQTL